MKVWAIGLLLLVSGAAGVRAADAIDAFPPAEPGMARHVLRLPARADESAFKVELIVGKTVELDDRNRYFFGGRIEVQAVRGWGYTRFVVARLGPMAGTLLAPDPDAPKAPRFVALGGEPYLIRYNSRLPLVVYVPEGVEVRYRIWSAGAEIRPMEKG